MFHIKWWVVVVIKTSCFHMYNTFECHFKPNQKSQSDMVDLVYTPTNNDPKKLGFMYWNQVFTKRMVFIQKLPSLCPLEVSIPLMRAFKWGTAWNFSSMGTWNTKGQTFTLLNLLNKRALSWNFWLWLVIILIPFEIKLHAVPHLKGLINGIYTSSGPRGGSLYIKTMGLGKTLF